MRMTEAMTHLSDGDVVRHLDGEGEAAERARRDEHVRSCAECAARVRRVGQQSETITTWLARTDPGLPAGSAAQVRAAGAAGTTRFGRPRPDAVRPWLRAAAIILLIAAPLAALQPVREWVAERIGGADDATAPATRTAETADPSVIRFTPAPGTFTVRVADTAAGAILAIGRTSGEEAVLRGVGGGDAPVVSEDALRLAGGAAATGRRFDLLVPVAVEEVRVIVGTRIERIGGAGLEAGSRVDLSVNR